MEDYWNSMDKINRSVLLIHHSIESSRNHRAGTEYCWMVEAPRSQGHYKSHYMSHSATYLQGHNRLISCIVDICHIYNQNKLNTLCKPWQSQQFYLLPWEWLPRFSVCWKGNFKQILHGRNMIDKINELSFKNFYCVSNHWTRSSSSCNIESFDKVK